MLTKDQLTQIEQNLWASTSSPGVYALLRDNMAVRKELGAIIGAAYAVLSENYGDLKQSSKLHRLEELLTLAEEKLT